MKYISTHVYDKKKLEHLYKTFLEIILTPSYFIVFCPSIRQKVNFDWKMFQNLKYQLNDDGTYIVNSDTGYIGFFNTFAAEDNCFHTQV